MLLCDGDFEATFVTYILKSGIMNQILLFAIPKRYENYLNIKGFRVYNVFFEKSKNFPEKKA